MDVIKTLRPGDSGTKKLTRRYGERLVCVRYRKDQNSNRRYTTIELIVDEGPIEPARASSAPVAKAAPAAEIPAAGEVNLPMPEEA